MASLLVDRGLRPEAMPHGTRARYVTGCRCEPCRGANATAWRARQEMAKALACEISAPVVPAPQTFTAPDGSKRVRFYRRACPGVHGNPCPLQAHLRKDSKGGVCGRCRELLVWNGLVSSHRARQHLQALSRAGMGRRSVADSCDVGSSILYLIKTGRKTRIRASTERRILAVDLAGASAGVRVPAGPTWRRIEQLLGEGFSKAELARRLGRKSPALQVGRRRVLARTAAAIERLLGQIELGA
jgi:hypothetical protein